MAEPTLAGLLELVHGRRGHFRLESGHHSSLWLDLDALFAEPRDRALRHAPDRTSAEAQARRQMPAPADGLYRTRYQLPPAYQSRGRAGGLPW